MLVIVIDDVIVICYLCDIDCNMLFYVSDVDCNMLFMLVM